MSKCLDDWKFEKIPRFFYNFWKNLFVFIYCKTALCAGPALPKSIISKSFLHLYPRQEEIHGVFLSFDDVEDIERKIAMHHIKSMF